MVTTAAMAYALTKIVCYSGIVIANPLAAPAAIVAAAPAVEAAAVAVATVAFTLPLP